MTDEKTLEKSLDWSYPSSPNAEKFKKPRGCWTLSVGVVGQPLRAINGFESRTEAIAHAKKHYPGIPWGRIWLLQNADLREDEA